MPDTFTPPVIPTTPVTPALLERLRHLAAAAELPATLHEAGIPEHALPRLAEEASAQWTGRFSSRHFDAEAALEIYRTAY